MRRRRLVSCLAAALLSTRVEACSFVVANFDVAKRDVPFEQANWYNQKRGPDATNFHKAHGWWFVHNLLSMTGAITKQPFVSADGAIVATFNGEIYNYRSLAAQLAGSEEAFASDGYALLPAYAKWGPKFVQHFEGEFALVLADFSRGIVIMSTDVFSTCVSTAALWDPHSHSCLRLTRRARSNLDRLTQQAALVRSLGRMHHAHLV